MIYNKAITMYLHIRYIIHNIAMFYAYTMHMHIAYCNCNEYVYV